MSDDLSIRGMEGLAETVFDIVNVYSTSDFSFNSDPIPGFPLGNYAGGQATLWVNPDAYNFNFQDNGFAGKYDSGDPRWRAKL